MNSVQVHLALTHVPVVLSLVGIMMLAVAFFMKHPTITKTSYILIVIAGIAAIPVFLSGEGSEEAVENLPGVSEAIIERHEDVAKLAMISIAVAGLAALAALLSFGKRIAARVFRVVVLLSTIISGALMIQTAHLGGQIRHTEIRSGVALQNGNENDEQNEGKAGQQQTGNDD
jgi:uncharacterized membrane protein